MLKLNTNAAKYMNMKINIPMLCRRRIAIENKREYVFEFYDPCRYIITYECDADLLILANSYKQAVKQMRAKLVALLPSHFDMKKIIFMCEMQ